MTPWGQKVFLVPLKSPTARGKTLGLFSADDGTGVGTASDIEAGRGRVLISGGRSFAGGSTGSRIVVVVPDGVMKVAFVFPPSLSVSVPARSNFASVQVNRECCGGSPAMIWYAVGGHVIKRIGNPAAAPAPNQDRRPRTADATVRSSTRPSRSAW